MPASSPAHQALVGAEALYRQHAAWVARYVMRLGARGQDVEDIVQETFLIAHRRGGFRPGPARATTWLGEIALRISLAHRRALRRAPVSNEIAVAAAASEGTDPLVGAMRVETLANVQRALDSLELERRALFVLFELEGESCEALSQVFEVPIGTIYSRLHAARTQFLAEFRRLTAEPGAGKAGGGTR